jgi:hypothetical protein
VKAKTGNKIAKETETRAEDRLERDQQDGSRASRGDMWEPWGARRRWDKQGGETHPDISVQKHGLGDSESDWGFGGCHVPPALGRPGNVASSV